MIKETISFVLPTGENCDLTLTQLNHNVVALQPTITLVNPIIPHTCFQHISNHICKLNLHYINSIYFESVKFKYKLISFNLFGHVRSAFKKELKKPIPIINLISNKDDYNWIEPDFLPKLTNNIDEILTLTEKHANCIILASKKGFIENCNYEMSNINIDYNYVYDLHPTDLIPVFDIYVSATLNITTPNIDPNIMKPLLSNIITQKYQKLGLNLKLF